ncbi:MAG: 2-amino-4-hydroxy-6-hydroxymethyldihydropteridine diphosphokinase [Candidatus Acidiferrales bacterium]
MSNRTAYLSLGSNVGERAEQIARAIAALGEAGVRVVRQSSLYRTEPVDFEVQSWFLNCVVEAETGLMPRQLLRAVRQVEQQLGRRKLVRRGPRAIDVDILLYGASRITAPDLEIPHPRMAERRFVLAPLAEIAPSLRHPALKKTVAELLAECPDRAAVVRMKRGNDSQPGGSCLRNDRALRENAPRHEPRR